MRIAIEQDNQLASNFTYSLAEAGWFLAKSKNQIPVEIKLRVIEKETVFFCTFQGEKTGAELDYPRCVEDKMKNPDEYYKTVEAGLKALSTYINNLLEQAGHCSALNTKQEAAHE
jgi:hypothetical protein